jgi:hypothetical protein
MRKKNMAGILNNKERVLDFLITRLGRDQVSSGRMRVEYASLTDRHTFYEHTGSHAPNVAEDASQRIFFETSERPQDLIVPELDGGTLMQPFKTEDFVISGRKIASGTFKTGAVTNVNVLSSSQISEVQNKLLKSLLNNFSAQRILGTNDLFNDTTNFSLTAHTASFAIIDNTLDFNKSYNSNLTNLPNIYSSDRFNHLPNFKFLPPVNRLRANEDEPVPVGIYPFLSSEVSDRFSTKENLDSYLEDKQVLELSFVETSRDNNLICQFFEFSEADAKVEKLSVIDYGEFSDSDPDSPGTHVYFVGRIRNDAHGTQTFINLFTVVFD